MFKKNALLRALLAAGLTAGLAACGGGSGGADESNTTDKPIETPADDGVGSSNIEGAEIMANQANQSLIGECETTSSKGFRSANFEVFSVKDVATIEDLKAAAFVAENGLEEIKKTMVIQDDEIFGPQGDQMISACLVMGEEEGHSGTAYLDGFVMQAPATGFSENTRNSTSRLLRHELTHVIQKRLVYGPEAELTGFDTDRWYSEGIASIISGQEITTAGTEVDAHLDAIVEGKETAAPYIRTYQDDMDAGGRYRDFALAVHYLLAPSPYGAGNPMSDGAEVWRRLNQKLASGSSDPFAEAFAEVFSHETLNMPSLSLSDYRDNFVTWLTKFRNDAWVTNQVSGSNSAEIGYMEIYEEGAEPLVAKQKVASDVSGQQFETLVTLLNPSKAYDVYFFHTTEATSTQVTFDLYGPLKGYASHKAAAFSANGPGGDNTFDTTNAAVKKGLVVDD